MVPLHIKIFWYLCKNQKIKKPYATLLWKHKRTLYLNMQVGPKDVVNDLILNQPVGQLTSTAVNMKMVTVFCDISCDNSPVNVQWECDNNQLIYTKN